MKARIKATGEIWEFSQIDEITFKSAINGHLYCAEELELLEPSVFTPDYWARLEHTYAGMAMNALLLTNNIRNGDLEGMRECNTNAMAIAYALVQKLKEKEVNNG